MIGALPMCCHKCAVMEKCITHILMLINKIQIMTFLSQFICSIIFRNLQLNLSMIRAMNIGLQGNVFT